MEIPMKKCMIIFSLFTTTSLFASIPKLINCSNGRALVLEVELTPLEAAVPIYNVKLTQAGVVVDNQTVYFRSNDDLNFSAEGYDRKTKHNITVHYNYETKDAYFQRSANNGLSPLPAAYFKDCAVR